MPFTIVRNDITKMAVDAIVNPTDAAFSGSGGVDEAVHSAAGIGLRKACEGVKSCGVGECKITRGYDLPCKYIIHTVGPKWKDGTAGEEILLKACYLTAIKAAIKKRCNTVAVPLISSGSFGYPKEKALTAATDAIKSALEEKDISVYLVVYDKQSYGISKALLGDIQSFINDRQLSEYSAQRSVKLFYRSAPKAKDTKPCGFAPLEDLEGRIKHIDESFSQMLLRKIDEKGMTDAQCYKKANIDRKLFSKIRSDVHYRPSKPTAIAFAIALELDLDQTKELLLKAGYALSHSNTFDIIIEYFIGKGIYNVFDINEALFAFDQNLLGA
ncbi:MAG: RNase III inhibitor [Ruminococcaceae bacterium]|nr:RNase III inhibitor [Oscillospiraceae bacterium]